MQTVYLLEGDTARELLQRFQIPFPNGFGCASARGIWSKSKKTTHISNMALYDNRFAHTRRRKYNDMKTKKGRIVSIQKTKTTWKIDNIFSISVANTSKDQKWKKTHLYCSPLMKCNDLAPTKRCWKPNLVHWFHSYFGIGILKSMTFPSTDSLSHRVQSNNNNKKREADDNLSVFLKYRIHSIFLLFIFRLNLGCFRTKTIFNSNFAVYFYSKAIDYEAKERCSECKNEAT